MINIIFEHTKHIELWDWLSHHPDKEKHEWPGWNINNENIFNQCFACEYAFLLTGKTKTECRSIIRCVKCPLQFPYNDDPDEPTLCMGKHGLFELYRDCEDLTERSRLAILIRITPLKNNIGVTQ